MWWRSLPHRPSSSRGHLSRDVPGAGWADPYAGEASHYDILGLTPAATHEEVREAYIQRALQHHPDRQDGQDVAGRASAERRMQDVNAAWAVLGNREARAAYDGELGITREAGELDDVPLAEPRPTGLRATLRRFLPLLIVLGVLMAVLVITAYAGPAPS